MDDVSFMDTASDEELEFPPPLLERIKQQWQAPLSQTGTSSVPTESSSRDAVRMGSSSVQSNTSASAFHVRGKPLTEVISNISRRSGGHTKPSRSSLEDWKSRMPTSEPDSSLKRDESSKSKQNDRETYTHLSRGVSEENHKSKAGMSGADERNLKSYSHSPIRGERGKEPFKSRSSEKGLLGAGVSTNPPLWSRTGSPSKVPYSSSPASSLHIQWDGRGRRQSTPLDSQRDRRSGDSSRSNSTSAFSPSRRHHTHIRTLHASPILISETPDSSMGKKVDRIGYKSHRPAKVEYQPGRDQSAFVPSSASLDDLLSPHPVDLSHKSPSHEIDRNSVERMHRRLYHSPPSSNTPWMSPFSPTHRNVPISPQKSPSNGRVRNLFRSPDKEHSPKKMFSSRSFSRKDPVWDHLDEGSSPPKGANGMLDKKTYHSSGRKSPAKSKDTSPFTHTSRRSGSWSVSRSHDRSITDSDDDLPLIKLKYNDKPDSYKTSPSSSYVSSHRYQSKSDHFKKSPSKPYTLTSSMVSPTKLVISPTKSPLSPSTSKSKAGKIVISPWRPWGERKGSSDTDILERSVPRERSERHSGDSEDGVPLHRLSNAKKRAQKMRAFFGFSSSDEDDHSDRHRDDKKRKTHDDKSCAELERDATSKKRRTDEPLRGEVSFRIGKSKTASQDNVSSTSVKPRKEHTKRHHRSPKHKETWASSHRSRRNDKKGLRAEKKEENSAVLKKPERAHSHVSSSGSTPPFLSSQGEWGDSPTASTFRYSSPSKDITSKFSPMATLSKQSPDIVALSSSGSGVRPSPDGIHITHARRELKKPQGPFLRGSRNSSDVPSTSTASSSLVTLVNDDSDDEIVMVQDNPDSFEYAAALVDSYSKKRKSRKANDTTEPLAAGSSTVSTGDTARERDAVSPSILERLNQLDEDEAMARRLQEEYDAEMARSVQQQSAQAAPAARDEPDQGRDAHVSCGDSAHASAPHGLGGFEPLPNISYEMSSNAPLQVGNLGLGVGIPMTMGILHPQPELDRPPTRRVGRGSRRRRGNNAEAEADAAGGAPSVSGLGRVAWPPNGGEWDDHFFDVRFPYPDLETDFGARLLEDLVGLRHGQGRGQGHGQGRGQGRGRARGRRRRDNQPEGHDGNNYDALLQLADRLGPAIDKRLTQAAIDRLPTFRFSADQHGRTEDESSCPICMDDYEEGAELRRLPCFHGYHKDCIDMWLKKNQDPMCPICRVEVRI